MPLQTIDLAPGVVIDDSALASEGGYVRAHRVRFVRGRPQTIGGWSRRISTPSGVVRALYGWINRPRDRLLAIGSHSRLQIQKDGVVYTITPSGLADGAIDGGSGGGYGMGLYGTGEYGQQTTGGTYLRTWSLDSWGDYLLANPRGETLYVWQGATGSPATAVPGAPAVIDSCFVDPNRFVVLLGTTDQGTGQFNPMLVRWSSQDAYDVYTATPTNTAGELPLSIGGRLVAGRAGAPSLIWSDRALYTMRLTGGAAVFAIQPAGEGCGLIGPNAAAVRDGRAYWMSPQGQFFAYGGGAPEPLPCPLLRHVFDHLDAAQADKIVCGVNGRYNEVWWFYPDARDGAECSRYVSYQWQEGVWSAGEMARSAWLDAGVFDHPIAAEPAGPIYDHEIGASADGGPIGEELISGAIDLGDGDALMRIDAIWPDLSDHVGVVEFSVLARDAPRGAERVFGPFALTPADVRKPFQAQGRHLRFKWRGANAPSFWRMGAPRFEIKPTGMRL